MTTVIHLVIAHDHIREVDYDSLPQRIHKSDDLYHGGGIVIRAHYVTLLKVSHDLIAVAACNAARAAGVSALALERVKKQSRRKAKNPPQNQLSFWRPEDF